MKVRWMAAAACIVFATALGVGTWAQAADAPAAKAADVKAQFVGATKCKVCHGAATGDQAKQWAASKHAKAFATLATPEAKAVGEKLGVADPQASDKCLSCHVTGFSAPKEQKAATLKNEDGVGCESCHGAGSKYAPMNIMKDHAASVANGLLAVNEATCTACHNKNSPTFKGFVYADMIKQVSHPNPKKAKAQ